MPMVRDDLNRLPTSVKRRSFASRVLEVITCSTKIVVPPKRCACPLVAFFESGLSGRSIESRFHRFPFNQNFASFG